MCGLAIRRQSCPFHADEDVAGKPVDDDGTPQFVCERVGHPQDGVLTWLEVPEPPDPPGLSGLAEELGLGVELPVLLNRYPGKWVEYGVLEAAYADAHPQDFAMLVGRYGHTAVAAKRYTVSSFLGGTLGRLSMRGDLLFRWGKPTGSWRYNSGISWWALPPAPSAGAEVLAVEMRREIRTQQGSVQFAPGQQQHMDVGVGEGIRRFGHSDFETVLLGVVNMASATVWRGTEMGLPWRPPSQMTEETQGLLVQHPAQRAKGRASLKLGTFESSRHQSAPPSIPTIPVRIIITTVDDWSRR